MITESTIIALAGLIAVIALLFLLIARFKWHVFLALLAPILLFAAIPGIDRTIFIEAFEQGFGGTIESIAVVIVLGSLLAEALKHTGGVERVTSSMIGWVGRKRMPLALTLSGFVIGIAIFSDVGYVILNPLVHSAALTTGTNMSVMATGLVGALQLTHALVPPTPGPLAAVALVGADLGKVIVLGILITLIGAIAGWIYALLVGPHVESPPSKEFVGQSFVEQGRESELPSTAWAYAPILVPLGLIAGQSVAGFWLPEAHIVNRIMLYLGWPVVALTVGIFLAYRSTKPEHGGERTSTWVEEALRTSAMIIVVTGLGGSLSQILRATPAVDTVAEFMVGTGTAVHFSSVRRGRDREHDHRIHHGWSNYRGGNRCSDDADSRLEPGSHHAGRGLRIHHCQIRQLQLLLGMHFTVANPVERRPDFLWRGHAGKRDHGNGRRVRPLGVGSHLIWMKRPDLTRKLTCGID